MREFCRDHQSFPREFRELIINQKFKAAQLKAHSLKGAAGNISAKNIQRAAEMLEISCIHTDQKKILDGLNALESGFAQLTKSLKNIKPNSSSSLTTNCRETNVDLEQALQMVKNLDNRLVECDPLGSERYVADINQYLPADAFTTDRKIMEQQIINYQFDAARETLRLMVTKLKRQYTHHERWNGTGYPKGLKEEEIPLAGRITCICDVFDALISERPYKTAWPMEKALEEIQSESGTYFDPRLVTLFVKMEPDLRRIVQTLGLL